MITAPSRTWLRAEFLLVWMAVFLSPMNYLRLDAYYFTASDACVLMALAIMARSGTISRRPFGPATGLWLAGFMLLAAGLTLGSIAGGTPSQLAVVLAQYAFSLILMPLALGGRSTQQTIDLLRALVWGILAVMLFGIYVIHFMHNPPPNFVSGSGRLQSLVERENECAALGAVGAVILMGLWQAGKARLIELVLAMPVLGYGIMLTGSNTGLGCLALGLIAMAVLTGSWRMMLAIAVLTGIGVAFIVWAPDLLPEVFRKRVLDGLLAGDISRAGTFSDRMLLIQEAFWLSRDHLLIGMGADQFRAISSHEAPVHNTYLLLLNEGGMLSLLGLTALMLTGVPLALNGFSDNATRPYRAITLTILVIYALMLNTFPHFYARFWNVPLILVFALAASLPNPGLAPVTRLRHVH